MSAVEGFMVCPPETTTSTPSEVRIDASPEPAATATKPRGFLGAFSSVGSDFCRALVGLEVHVVDEDLENLATLEHVGKDLVGRVGVHVHLEVWVLAHEQLAITHRGEKRERGVAVEGLVVGMEEELVAVAVLRALPVVVELDGNLGRDGGLGISGVHGGLEVRDLAGLALDRVHESLEEGGKAKGTGIDNAVLLEDGQELGCAGNGLVGLDDQCVEHLGGRDVGLLELVGTGGHVTQDGEDGSLDGLAHSLEGNLHRAAERVCDVGGRGVVLILGVAEPLGEAAQNLGGNDTGVAACAHERAMGDRLGDVLDGGVLRERLHLLDDGPKGERHVGTGVAVGNGEDVELVDLLGSLGNDVRRHGEARADD
jgi:hypothetical protein